jgi:Domain of unknown function (DUF397)
VRQDEWRREPALAQLLGRIPLRVRLVAVALCLLAAGAAVITLASGRVARSYLMAQADRELLAYAHQLASRSFLAAPQVPVDTGLMGTGEGKFSIEVRGSDGHLVLRAGPAGRPGPAAWVATPRFGQLTTLPGATGGSYLAVAEPIRYSARHIPFAYSAADFSLVVTTRAGPGLDGALIVGLDLASIDQLTSTLTSAGLAVSGLALLAVAGLGTMAVRAALRPFTRLETTAAAIAAGGPAEPRPAGHAGDDPGRRASPLNSVLARMTRPGSGAQASAARDQAGRVPRAVAEISRELRRPISVLHGLAEHYRQQGALPASGRDRILRRVAEEAARIDALADDLRHCADVPLRHTEGGGAGARAPRRPGEEGDRHMDLAGATWRKSSYSGGNGGACVEVRVEPGSKEGSDYVVTMRDSKDPNGPVLTFTPDEWRAFTLGIQDGEFDLAEDRDQPTA